MSLTVTASLSSMLAKQSVVTLGMLLLRFGQPMNRLGTRSRLNTCRAFLFAMVLITVGCSRSEKPPADGAQNAPPPAGALQAQAPTAEPQSTSSDSPPDPPSNQETADSDMSAVDSEVNAPPPLEDDFSLYDSAPVLGASGVDAPQPEPELDMEQCTVLPLPFSVVGCIPGATKDVCVAWGFEFEDAPSEPYPPFPNKTRLVIFDLANGKVLVERVVDTTLTQVVCNATGIYAAGPPSQNQFTVFRISNEDLETLGSIDVKSGRLVPVGDRFLVVKTARRLDQVKLSLPDLQVEQDSDGVPPLADTQAIQIQQLSEGWLFEGVLWSHDLKTPKMIVSAAGVTPAQAAISSERTIVAEPFFAGFWTHTRNDRAPVEASHVANRPRYSPHIPAEITFDENYRLSFSDFTTKAMLNEIHFPDEFTGGSLPSTVGITTSPSWILVSLKGKAVAISMDSPSIPTKTPFQIEPSQSTLVLNLEKPTVVNYRSQNAIKFELEIPAFKVDGKPLLLQSSTGEFTIDVPSYLPSVINAKAEGSFANSYRLDQAAAQGRKSFSKITGTEPSGLPLALTCAVRAYSDNLSVALLEHIYFLDVPLSDFEKSRDDRKAAMLADKAARNEQYAESRGNRSATSSKPAIASSPVEPLVETKKHTVRTWTDRQGRKVRATLKSFNGIVAQVIDARGQTLRIPVERLGDEDQVWLEEHATISP